MRLTMTWWVNGGVLAAVMAVLWYQAFHYVWQPHLVADVHTFWARATHFVSNWSWAGMTYNEHLPGTLWFFAAALLWSVAPLTFESYTLGVVVLNVLLLVAHDFVYRRWGGRYSPIMFAFLLLAMGPVLLFRFEPLVGLLTLLAWVLFVRYRLVAAALVLGVAIAVKIYPVVLLPVFVAEAVRSRQWLKAGLVVVACGVGFSLVVLSFVGTGGSVVGFVEAVGKHELKPIGLEGVWGNVATVWQVVLEGSPEVGAGYGIHGLAPFAGLSLAFFDRVWVVPYGVVLGYLLYIGRKNGYMDPGMPLILLLTFLLFSKVINPQYLWWFVIFLPLVDGEKMSGMVRWGLAAVAVIALVMTQAVFPVGYTEYLDWFYGRGDWWLYVYVNVVRNLLLFVLLGLMIRHMWSGRVSDA